MSRDLQEILSSGEVTEILKGGIATGNQVTDQDDIDTLRPDRIYFAGKSRSTITVSEDASNPSFFPLDDLFFSKGCELFNISNGEVKNTSGRTISALTGTFSFTPEKDGAGTTSLYIVSEYSDDDGFTWITRTESLRVFELKKDINQFGTKLSMAFNWQPNGLLRFKAYVSDSLDLVSPTTTIDGEVCTGPSWFWTLSEI